MAPIGFFQEAKLGAITAVRDYRCHAHVPRLRLLNPPLTTLSAPIVAASRQAVDTVSHVL
jgi:hypothetical protein